MRPAHVILLAAIVFVVYGSLFPFDFQPQATPLGELFSNWHPFLNRADAVDNILLFVPLGLSLHFVFERRHTRHMACVLVWLVLGLGLQWAQLFVPGRVASLADAINNAIGLVIGLWVAGRIAPWLAGRRLAGSVGDTFALLLVLAWYTYESFPFVPTLDVGLLGAHLKSALSPEPFDILRLGRHALAAALGTMLLLRAHPLHARRANIAAAATLLLLSEVLVPYGDLRVETLLGIVAGLGAGEWLDRSFGARSRRIVMALAFAAFATTVLTPFRAQPAGGGFTLTPFSGLLWFGNTSGIPPTAFETLAIGALLWSGLAPGSKASAFARRWPWLVLALLLAAELARVHVLGFRGDTTTLFLWIILAPLARLMGRADAPAPIAGTQAAPGRDGRGGGQTGAAASMAGAASRGRPAVLLRAAASLACLTVVLWLALRLPTIPYNVKELFEAPKMPRIALFSAALLWLGWGPWWVAAAADRSRAGALWLPVRMFAASMLSLLLLTLSVTQESLSDIIGSPDLYRRVTADGLWGAEWSARMASWPAQLVQAVEQTLRFVALYGLLLVPLTIVAMQLCGTWTTGRKWAGIAIAAAAWWLAKLVVVDWAITDNLTELIALGGVPYLAAVLALLAINVAVCVAGVGAGVRGMLTAAIVSALFVPATWWLLMHGLEPMLIKYGLVYSAVQFLLGQNRSIQLTEWQLFGRWAVLYLSTLGVLAWGMHLATRFSAPTRTNARTGAPARRQVR